MFENLKAFRKAQNMTQEDFSKTIIVNGKPLTRTTYANYESRKTEPDSDFWIAVAEKYQVSVDYLMGFCDDPHSTKYAVGFNANQQERNLVTSWRIADERAKEDVAHALRDFGFTYEHDTGSDKVVEFGRIRHYIYGAAAGKGSLAEGYYEYIPRTPDMPKDADFCLNVSGDSMAPTINDGDLIFVKVNAVIAPYDVGLWAYQGEDYVKIFDPQPDGSIHLLSANPARKDSNVTVSADTAGDLRPLGKVLGYGKIQRPVYK